MITILSGLVGLLGSFLPSLLNYFTANANNDYQLKLIEAQAAAAREGVELQIQANQTKADVELQQELYSYDNGPSGNKFVDALRSSVRPVITYIFLGIWIEVTIFGFFYGIFSQGHSVAEVVPIVWDQNTQAIFMAIIGFWFGGHMLEKYGMFPIINEPKAKAYPTTKA